MKLITLNIWGGKVFEPLMDFFKKHQEDTDIFCLQEVFNNPPQIKSRVQTKSAKEDIYKDIAEVLKNFDGHWTPNFKGDNPARLEQSENIKKLLDNFEGAKILCGDFNVVPDTKSMEILETSMRNLVKEYNITTTRSHFYTKEHKFADYILVSPEIQVKKFEVIQDVVSDHLPLMLEFD